MNELTPPVEHESGDGVREPLPSSRSTPALFGALAVVVAWVLATVATVPLALLEPAVERPPAMQVIGMTLAGLAGAALVLGLGLAAAWRPSEVRFAWWFTLIVAALAALCWGMVAFYAGMKGGTPESGNVWTYMQAIFGIAGTMYGLTALARLLRLRIGGVLTAGVAVGGMFCIPFGTIAGLVWLFAARRRESNIT